MLPTRTATESVPVAIVPAWSAPVLTPRGTALLALLRAQDQVRALGAADREYLAPYAAELLVDCTTDLPPTA